MKEYYKDFDVIHNPRSLDLEFILQKTSFYQETKGESKNDFSPGIVFKPWNESNPGWDLFIPLHCLATNSGSFLPLFLPSSEKNQRIKESKNQRIKESKNQRI